MIKYCLIVLLSLLTLSSCLSTQVSTHTIPDGVGKEVYHWVSWPDKVELYERGGVYYARCEFYRVPARKPFIPLIFSAKDAGGIRII